jgi:hypothetical protein
MNEFMYGWMDGRVVTVNLLLSCNSRKVVHSLIAWRLRRGANDYVQLIKCDLSCGGGMVRT